MDGVGIAMGRGFFGRMQVRKPACSWYLLVLFSRLGQMIFQRIYPSQVPTCLASAVKTKKPSSLRGDDGFFLCCILERQEIPASRIIMDYLKVVHPRISSG